MDAKRYYLNPGYIFFSEEAYIIETVLGSCVSVCLWDRVKKQGGMNHYIYARYREAEKKTISGSIAIPHLINIMQKHGSQIKNMEAYVVGGAKNSNLNADIGNENVEIAKQILTEKKVKIIQIHVGGEEGRKLLFNNYSGTIKVTMLKAKAIQTPQYFEKR